MTLHVAVSTTHRSMWFVLTARLPRRVTQVLTLHQHRITEFNIINNEFSRGYTVSTQMWTGSVEDVRNLRCAWVVLLIVG